MKTKIIFFLVILLPLCLQGQNLINNPGFESHDTCPNTVSQLYYCTGWEQLLETADYFNKCGSLDGGVPNNFWGIQCPNSGDAYAGLICYWQVGGPKAREIIGTQLNAPLIIGQKYYETYHITLSKKLSFACGINKFGIKLRTVPFQHDSTLIDNNPFWYSDSIVLDTAGWVQIKFSFIADSAYQYIALGEFFVDSLLSIDHALTVSTNTYYYIDDICLSTDSLTCNLPVTTNCYSTGINDVRVPEFSLHPNPFSDFLQIELKDESDGELILYDIAGRAIIKARIATAMTLNTKNISSGFYYYTISHRNRIINSGKLLKQ